MIQFLSNEIRAADKAANEVNVPILCKGHLTVLYDKKASPHFRNFVCFTFTAKKKKTLNTGLEFILSNSPAGG